MTNFIQDLLYSLRTLRKRPTVAAIVIATLAIGIGANTAIFSIVNAVLLQPLPFKDPERLVWITETIPEKGVKNMRVAPPTFMDYRAQQQSFEELAAYTEESLILSGQGEPERIPAAAVSANYLSMLSPSPPVGRFLVTEEDRVGAAPVVVLSHRLWRERFNADLSAIGKAITLDGTSYEIVGIAPANFTAPIGEFAPQGVAVWLPLMPRIASGLDTRGAHFLAVVGRLKSDRSVSQAQAELTTVAQVIAQSDSSYQGYGARVISLHQQITGDVKQPLFILFVAVGLVLLIACANIANVLLAQATTRQREVAIRLALGASRKRLIRQLLTESVLLALTGGALGLLVSLWAVDLLVELSGPNLPRGAEISINWPVVLYALLVAVGTGLGFGLAPAMQATKTNVNTALKEGGLGITTGLYHRRARGFLVVAEVALTSVLVIGAGLMLKSFAQVLRVHPGFDPVPVTAFIISLPDSKYPEKNQRVAFFASLQERLAAIPGVRSVGAVNNLPTAGQSMSSPITIEGRPSAASDKPRQAQYAKVDGDYFRAMSIPLLRGRLFTARDNASAPPVMIINEALARQHFPGEDPIGKKMKTMFQGRGMREIVGVVGDVRHSGPLKDAPPQVYEPYSENPTSSLSVIVQADTRAGLMTAVRSAVQELDKDQPIDRTVAMAGLLSDSISGPRFYTSLLSVFAALAFGLAALGIYGVMSYAVTQRTHEIGIRIAIGAQTTDVLRLILKNGMRLALVGVAIGLISALGLTRLMRTLLFGVTPTDVVTFVCAPIVLLIASFLACWIPARRATRVDPLIALRYE